MTISNAGQPEPTNEQIQMILKALQASNRLHAAGMTQRQSNQQASTNLLKALVDGLFGGQHALMEGLNTVQTFQFHDAEEADKRWKVLIDLMGDVMEVLLRIEERLEGPTSA